MSAGGDLFDQFDDGVDDGERPGLGGKALRVLDDTALPLDQTYGDASAADVDADRVAAAHCVESLPESARMRCFDTRARGLISVYTSAQTLPDCHLPRMTGGPTAGAYRSQMAPSCLRTRPSSRIRSSIVPSVTPNRRDR